jgi:hypothetical protein
MTTVSSPISRDIAALAAARAALERHSASESDSAHGLLVARFDQFLGALREQADHEATSVLRRLSPTPTPVSDDAPATEPDGPAATSPESIPEGPSVDCVTRAAAVAHDSAPPEVPDEPDDTFWHDDERPWSSRVVGVPKARVFQGAGVAAFVAAVLLHFS